MNRVGTIAHRLLTPGEIHAAERRERLHRKLAWAHGPARAEAIMNDQDPAAAADEAAWARLGRGTDGP